MAIGNFSTSNQTYRMLMGNGLIYSVPRFQRDYSWTEEEWDDLWRDIENTLEEGGNEAHYMGYLVLQSQDNKHFDIIDGQQRLATLSIVVLAVLAALNNTIQRGVDAENNRKRASQLRSSFIGYLDPVTLVTKSKLNLNRNNDNIYQNYLVPLQPAPRRNLKPTEHQMRRAFEWWYEKISHAFRSGEDLARFIDKLSDRLFFTVITVTDELNAYKVFETLNARGVKLSSTDLLKNYLFSVVHNQTRDEHELSRLEQLWESVVGKLGSEEFPDFLRVHWNSRNSFLRHSELFKGIRDSIRDRGHVFNLVRDMDADVEVYVAFSKPEDEFWTNEQSRILKELRMFNVRQLYPLLLAAHRALSQAEFTHVLRAVSVISFRYNVICGKAANEQERVYNSVAFRIHQGLHGYRDVINQLAPLYPSDVEFRTAFSRKSLKTSQARNKRIVRYILFKIESHISNAQYEFESEKYSLEHIMPENPEANWEGVSDIDHQQYVYRLGNMTILSAAQNREVGNSSFIDKRPILVASEFSITRRIAEEYSVWDLASIDAHQDWMARQATGIWRVSQFSPH